MHVPWGTSKVTSYCPCLRNKTGLRPSSFKFCESCSWPTVSPCSSYPWQRGFPRLCPQPLSLQSSSGTLPHSRNSAAHFQRSEHHSRLLTSSISNGLLDWVWLVLQTEHIQDGIHARPLYSLAIDSIPPSHWRLKSLNTFTTFRSPTSHHNQGATYYYLISSQFMLFSVLLIQSQA
jgi:hypothetical protein